MHGVLHTVVPRDEKRSVSSNLFHLAGDIILKSHGKFVRSNMPKKTVEKTTILSPRISCYPA